MKLMILSMFAALSLSDLVTNVLHDFTTIVIQNNRRLLTENCPTIDECEPQLDKTFVKYTCNNIDQLVRKEYSKEPCDSTTKLPGKIKSQPNDPCCANRYYRCPQEEKDSVGICEYIGERAFPPGDPNYEMLPAYRMRFCNELDGSGGLTIRANDCDIQSPLYSSSIQDQDPCCETSRPSCDKELGTCVYNVRSEYSSKYYCDGDGRIIYASWEGKSDCSDQTKVVMSCAYLGDPCCPANCDKKLGQCVYNEASGYSNKYYCGKGLIYASWKGVTDCSDPKQVAMSSITDDPICCPV